MKPAERTQSFRALLAAQEKSECSSPALLFAAIAVRVRQVDDTGSDAKGARSGLARTREGQAVGDEVRFVHDQLEASRLGIPLQSSEMGAGIG